VRTDIPLADQIVQVGDVCLEAGRRFAQPSDSCHLIVLRVSSKNFLREAALRLEIAGIRYVMFYEPDDELGHTAICTEPVRREFRREFRRYAMWGARGPPRY
jgi:hypothetical protein